MDKHLSQARTAEVGGTEAIPVAYVKWGDFEPRLEWNPKFPIWDGQTGQDIPLFSHAVIAPSRCEHCDGTGDVHRNGEWLGYCTCEAGIELKSRPEEWLEPSQAVTVRYNTAKANVEGAIRDKLIAMGWTPPNPWRPISTAPKDGSEILAWRADCGALIVRWTCCEDFCTETEMEGMSDEALSSYDWFFADFVAGGRLEETPTHWMPLPAPPLSKSGDSDA